MCNFCWPFYSQFCTVWYVGVLIVLQPQDTICIHICTWPSGKVSPDPFRSGCTHFWHSILIIYGLYQCIQNSKLSYIFLSKHMEGQILRFINSYLYFILISLFFLLMPVCVLEDAHFGEGELWSLLILREFIISPQSGLERWWIMFIFKNCNLVLPMRLPLHTQCWGE